MKMRPNQLREEVRYLRNRLAEKEKKLADYDSFFSAFRHVLNVDEKQGWQPDD